MMPVLFSSSFFVGSDIRGDEVVTERGSGVSSGSWGSVLLSRLREVVECGNACWTHGEESEDEEEDRVGDVIFFQGHFHVDLRVKGTKGEDVRNDKDAKGEANVA